MASRPPAKGQRRPLGTLMNKKASEPTIPSVPSIPTFFPAKKSPAVGNRATAKTPTNPALASVERAQNTGIETSHKKDDLWGAFRTLDGDYQKFRSRTSTLKTAVVRSSLLPFLRNYENCPLDAPLRPVDLDRRANIFNRWWTGLLEMLNGRNGESVTGSDRPTVLEAVTLIMVRPEWNVPFHVSRSRCYAGIRPLLSSRSTTSLGSASSDFLADSVLHNIKTSYVQNLLSQMAYVVERMSSRSVPASVVAFCGKATAYAFFYCEGVADILVRLWNPSPERIRRVLAEHHLERDVVLKDMAEPVAASFPSGLRGLAFRSVRTTTRYLRSRPQISMAMTYIPWHGPWVGRWAGGDTDLFFVFVKVYYNLLHKFLPTEATLEETVCSPGYVLLEAQILTVLHNVIQKSNGLPQPEPLCAALPDDDLLSETDASASVLPIRPASTNRSMAEHRLIMLLRDCLSGSTWVVGTARELFARSFEGILKAAARRTSLFNHHACFTLCDFMEEALAILVRYQSGLSSALSLDWPFWLQVCRQMMESHNTMTEIRLYAFLYSLWNIIIAEESRKRQVCLEWLLDEEFFGKQFSHWCPMVRAYHMRLLCWRVGRLGECTSELDHRILKILALRLHRVWGGFLYLQTAALERGGPRLSTAPCSPAPNRRLLIVRNDSQPSSGGMFLTFDSILSPSSSTVATAYERHSSLGPIMGEAKSQESNGAPSVGMKSWALLRNMIPFAKSTLDSAATQTKRGNAAAARNQVNGLRPSKKSNGEDNTAFRARSFKFALEWIDSEKSPFGKERQLYRPRLPLPASDDLVRPAPTQATLHDYKGEGAAANQSKYAGRALAEWDLLIDEYRDFSKRRLVEGVPNGPLVETPTLGIETFRRSG
ncbi:MAG: hypothetical protein LQ346_003165 [Caloplaca aetnensis]|nr:MAG: hypothetical protein LQ346_003165 [Caloplaca aetnensis]